MNGSIRRLRAKKTSAWLLTICLVIALWTLSCHGRKVVVIESDMKIEEIDADYYKISKALYVRILKRITELERKLAEYEAKNAK